MYPIDNRIYLIAKLKTFYCITHLHISKTFHILQNEKLRKIQLISTQILPLTNLKVLIGHNM